MNRAKSRPIAICLTLIASAWLVAASDADPKSKAANAALGTAPTGVVVVTTALQPFTRIAYIPAGADLSSIQFESVKAVKVPTVRVSTADPRYCEAGSPEPGGSLDCPYVRDESLVPAYRITYSFRGPPMAADEYAGTWFTFSVNMRLEELSPAVRQAISARKVSRTAAEKFFALTTSRGFVQRKAIDQTNSVFCDGRDTDGSWTQTATNCEEKVTYKTVAAPSDYIAVRVDPAPVR